MTTLLNSWVGLTGEGHDHLAPDPGVWVIVSDLDVTVTSWTVKQREVGTMHPLGLWYAGEVFIGYDDGADIHLYSWGFFLHHERSDVFPPPSNLGGWYTHDLFWRLKPGVTINVDLYV